MTLSIPENKRKSLVSPFYENVVAHLSNNIKYPVPPVKV